MEDERTEPFDGSPAATQPEQPAPSIDPGELQTQRDEYYDRLLRKTAEFDNYRKPIDRERIQLSEAAAADLVNGELSTVN